MPLFELTLPYDLVSSNYRQKWHRLSYARMSLIDYYAELDLGSGLGRIA